MDQFVQIGFREMTSRFFLRKPCFGFRGLSRACESTVKSGKITSGLLVEPCRQKGLCISTGLVLAWHD